MNTNTSFELFNKVFSDYASETALIYNDETSLTFAQVKDRASRLVSLLRKRGVRDGALVAILMERTPDYLIAVAACILFGFGFIPMDTEYPKQRISMILEDSKADFVIDNEVFVLSAMEQPAEPSSFIPSKDLPAYLVYTSGSTGKPKGILHTQESLALAAVRNRAAFELNNRDIWGAAAPFTFVALVVEILASWLAGAAIRVIPRTIVKDPDILSAYISDNGITATFIAPRALRLFKKTGTSLKFVVAGGENPTHISPEGFRVIGAYGQSETGGPCVFVDIEKGHERKPIGLPSPDVHVYLLDENNKEVEEGEICLSGCFMKGYLNLEEATRETLIANPFYPEDSNETLLRTGDLGKRLPDGSVLFVNRKDWMIKINGQRVEPGEIEAVLRSIEGISEAAVKSFVNRYQQTYICAYYVSDGKIDNEGIRRILLDKLPSYMVPSFLVKLETLPLNQNRKLDRSALMEPDASAFLTQYVEPANETEAILCRAFSKVLGISGVGSADDFFKLGGDSLKAMMVAQEASTVKVSVKHIFMGKTPRDIAVLISSQIEESVVSDVDSVSMPLSDSQMGIFLDSSEEKPDCRYNIPFVLSFPADKTDVNKLKTAVMDAWKKHQAFSLSLDLSTGTPSFVKRTGTYPNPEIVETDEAGFEKLKAGFVKPFDLKEDFLYRAVLVKTSYNIHLLFDIHHLIFDGTSLGIFCKSICDSYEGLVSEPETITPFMVSASDSAAKESLAYKESLDYFATTISGSDVDSNLNPDVNIPGLETAKGVSEISLDSDSKAVEFFAHTMGITENSFFAAAFALLLSKFTCQKESLFVSVDNGRHSTGMERSVGMFVKTFPVYVPVDETSSVVDFLHDVQERFFGAMSHDNASFADIAAACSINSSVKFVYQAELLSGFDFNGTRIKSEMLPVDDTMSNLDMMVMKQNGGYRVSVGFRKSKFSQGLIDSFVASYNSLVDSLLKSSSLNELSFLPEPQRSVLDGFNLTDSEYDTSETALDYFRRRVSSRPESLAVFYEGKQYTYKEFDELTDRLACFISARGLGKGDFVAVMTKRSHFMPVLAWSVVKAGAAYQPLDPSYPVERLSFMVSDSKARLLITDRDLLPAVGSFDGKVLFTDEIESLPKGSLPKVELAPESPLVILYTSGTTGLPKGVVLTHSNVVAFANSHVASFELTEDSRCASYASFGFDACLMDMFSVLMSGGCLCIIPESIRLDLKALGSYYKTHGITHGFVTTQLGCMLAQSLDCPDFKALLIGGEKIIPFKPSGKFRVINGYGPTETLAYVTHYDVKDDSPIQPIGTPNSNTKIYIADSYGRRMPLGACGELLIAGPQVSAGYLNRPDKTSEVFVKNRFTEDPFYSRVYRTGDIARILPDGNVEYVGRRDGQVKVRGFRIELTEVEQVIRAFDGISNATVQAFDDPAGGKFIAAYIVSGKPVSIDKLNEFIESQKPSYMVPAVTMQLDAIPLNQNGKVDKKKLPLPVREQEDLVPPENDLQKKILDVVSSVLGTDRLGITSDIFRAGLTSLGAIRLNALLSDTFGVVVQTRDLKANSTVKALDKFISTASKPEETVVVYPDYPLTKTQEGIFLECQGKPDSTFYNIPYLLKISPEIDIKRLRLSICEAVEAHSYINTTLFFDKDGNVRQKLPCAGCFSSEDVELIKATTLDEVKASLVKPFSLVGGKLFRISIIQTRDELCLFMDFHHIICDGTSVLVFVGDIEQAYLGKAPLAEVFTGFDVARSEQKLRNSNAFADAEEYYQNLLTGFDTDSLPKPVVHAFSEKGSGVYVTRGKNSTVEAIRSYCKKKNVSENSVLCTAFGHVLSLYNATETSMFTTVYNGRNDSRMGRTVSMLVKTLPVLFNPAERRTDELVSKISSQLMDSMSNDLYSFAEISRAFGLKSDVMFIFQGEGFEQTSFCGASCKQEDLSLSDRKAPLCVQVTRRNGLYEYNVDYDPERFTEDFAGCFCSALETALEQLPESELISDLCLVDEKTAVLMDRINHRETQLDFSRFPDICLKEWAEKTPDTPAVEFEDVTLSYREFDALTDKLAGYLMNKGAKKNSFVAVLIGRSHFMSLTSWGIVKSGAAYLPIDPTYPQERIDLMISDSGTDIIILERCYRDLIKGFTGTVIYTDEIEKLPECGKIAVSHDKEDPFILIYSSGSTGTPKGTMLPLRSMMALAESMRTIGLIPGDRYAFYASFGFDAGLMDIFVPLMTGGTTCVIPESIRLDIPALEDFFVRKAITFGFMTTQVARTFLQNTKCKTLRNFMFGGEKMVPFTPPENFNVFNGYGPSETNCYVTLFRVVNDCSVQPVGTQSVNTKLYVVDKQGRLLPPCACGELCIAGPQTGLGYLNRPEKTASSFIPNPFCKDPLYSTLYKTGDIVRMLPDGSYDFVGRRDGQVKIRGFRIELGEVEHVISEYPSVKQVTAQVFDDPNGGKFIAAYIVNEGELSVDDLSAFIRARKPAYMVPGFIAQIDAIPLTANGKVNKAKLPAPDTRSQGKGEEPQNETEKKFCHLFEALLGLEKVYADDDFFMIGGTSISALQLVVKCVNEGFMIVYKNIFENPTPRLLAKLVSGNEKEKDFFAPSGEEAKKYDYSALEYNVPANLDRICNNGVGNVLLTGATGFLGAHIMIHLLRKTTSNVICLVRSKEGLNAEERLRMIGEYYFEDDLSDYLGSRLMVADGSLSDQDLVEKLGTYEFDTIINCAANVHHFGTEEALMRDNFNGIKLLIQLAMSRNARLVQTSSLSVCGESVNGHISPKTVFFENNLNIGQSLENMYVRTKYLAEQEIIDACSKGLRGKIIRLGNLMGRDEDGEFQINSSTSGFLKLLSGYKLLGCYPIDMLDNYVEFSPIDRVSEAVVLLSGTPDEFTVFHANNAHSAHMANVLEIMKEMGYKIDFVQPSEFIEKFNELSKDESKAKELSGLLAYMNRVGENVAGSVRKGNQRDDSAIDTRIKIAQDNSFTTKALYRLGFSWPLTDMNYLRNLLGNLKDLNFFD